MTFPCGLTGHCYFNQKSYNERFTKRGRKISRTRCEHSADQIWKGPQHRMGAFPNRETVVGRGKVGTDWDVCTGLSAVSGVNGYVCIDIDKIKNAAVVAAVLQGLGLTEEYQWQVQSGSGEGRHIWVRASDPLPFKKGVLWGYSKDGSFDHLEIRWKNCYTILPPSQHASGNKYQWLKDEPIDEPMMVSDEAILAAFEAVAHVRVEDPSKDKPEYKKTRYSEIIMNGVDEGQRNETLASMAGHLRKQGLEYSEALQWLKLWNGTLRSPLPAEEVENTLKSIYSYPSSEIILRDGMEMNLMERPVLNDIVEGVIGEKSFNFLSGEEGAGKSLLAMNLSLAISTGLPNFLHYRINKHGKVLYLNNELSFASFLQRFKTMRTKFYHEQSKNLGNFLTPETIGPLSESWEDIVKILIRENPTLVVLDCFYWAHNGQENNASEMKDIMRKLVALRDKYGVAVLIVHHTKKGVRVRNDA